MGDIMDGRAIVVGIDGGVLSDFNEVLLEACNDGTFFSKSDRCLLNDILCNLNSKGEYEVTMPPITIPSWTSLFSGMTPDEMDTYGFYDRQVVDGRFQLSEIEMNNSIKARYNKIEYLWDTGIESNVMNVPMTYPVDSHDGVMISGIMTPDVNGKMCSGYSIDKFPLDYKPDVDQFNMRSLKYKDSSHFFSSAKDIYQSHRKVAVDIFGIGDWDLYTYVDMEVDRLSHQFYDRDFGFVEDSYKRILKLLSWIKENMRDDDVLFLLSDHGIEETKNVINISNMIDCVVDDESYWCTGGMSSRVYLNVEDRDMINSGEGIKQDDYLDIVSTFVSMFNELDVDAEVLMRTEDEVMDIKRKPDLMINAPNTRFIRDTENYSGFEVSNQFTRVLPSHSARGMFVVVDNQERFGDVDIGTYKDVRPLIEKVI